MKPIRDSSEFGGIVHAVDATFLPQALECSNVVLSAILSTYAYKSQLFQYRLRALEDHPLVGDVRGVGLMGGVELVADKQTGKPFESSLGVGLVCTEQAHQGGLLIRPLGDTIAICPPLIITGDQIDELFGKLESALDKTLEQVSDQMSG